MNPLCEAKNEMELKMLGECFDRKRGYDVLERKRPHWFQDGTVTFITMRTHDSIPRSVLERWEREKADWLIRQGYRDNRHWSDMLPELPQQQQLKFKRRFARLREDLLDECQGRCLLKLPQLRKIVSDALLYFDGERYELGDFVVMPNHIHLLASFRDAESIAKQCESWMRFTARQINAVTGERGRFWQREPFDHLVRSLDQYEYLRRYIADNPQKAKLPEGTYSYRSG